MRETNGFLSCLRLIELSRLNKELAHKAHFRKKALSPLPCYKCFWKQIVTEFIHEFLEDLEYLVWSIALKICPS